MRDENFTEKIRVFFREKFAREISNKNIYVV